MTVQLPYKCDGLAHFSTSAAGNDAIIQDPTLRQIIDVCVCNGLMSTKPGKVICTKLAFQINHDSICAAMASFLLGLIPDNAAFQFAL